MNFFLILKKLKKNKIYNRPEEKKENPIFFQFLCQKKAKFQHPPPKPKKKTLSLQCLTLLRRLFSYSISLENNVPKHNGHDKIINFFQYPNHEKYSLVYLISIWRIWGEEGCGGVLEFIDISMVPLFCHFYLLFENIVMKLKWQSSSVRRFYFS